MESRIVRVPLERIQPNPWQVRLDVDQEHVQALAADIAQRGLLQAPAGRVIDGAGRSVSLNLSADPEAYIREATDLFVQLAFGHNRLAALKELLEGGNADFATMPVRIQDLTDEELATAAWAENMQRKDLSPVEEAMAIRRRVEDFGWTQERVAEELGLARSTVANKLRLLELPEEVQEKVVTGEIPERSARALCSYYLLPENLRETVGEDYYLGRTLKKPDQATAEQIHREVEDAIKRVTNVLGGDFPPDEVLVGAGVFQPTCEDCPAILPRKKGSRRRCGDPACYKAKKKEWQLIRLARASEVTGIAFLEPDDSYRNMFSGYGDRDRAALEHARETNCENLRLVIPAHTYGDYLHPEGFDDICYSCVAKECSCRQQASAEEEALKEKREAEVERIQNRTAERVAKALLAGEVPALRALLYAITDNWQRSDQLLRLEDPMQICQKIAHTIVLTGPERHNTDPEEYQQQINAWLDLRGFDVVGDDAAPLRQLHEQLARIRGFVESQGETAPRAALEGNLDNLDKLRQELHSLDGKIGRSDRHMLHVAIDKVERQLKQRLRNVSAETVEVEGASQ